MKKTIRMFSKYLSIILAMLLLAGVAYGQNVTVSGVVTSSEDGLSIPGVTVVQKGTSNGVSTGIDGRYSISVPPGSTLQFSFLGMKQQEILVGNQTTINVALVPDVLGMGEVVVTTALGFNRKARSVGYSTDKIDGQDIVQLQAPTLVTGLAGKAAGVNVTIPNGIEGGSQRITIRGNSSINGNNQPLFIIDGIPVENNPLIGGGVGTNGGVDWGSSINNINPYDIEEYTVLKGPAAAALYGARGANGVVIIKTKKGKTLDRGIGIEYTLSHRVNNVYRYKEVQNKYGFGGPPGALWEIPRLYTNTDGEYYYPIAWGGDRPVYGGIPGGYNSWDHFSWYGSAASWGAEMNGEQMRWWDGEMRTYSPQPDNMEIFFKNGSTQSHNIAFYGGSEMGSVRFSLTNTKNDAVIHNSNFKQTTATLGSSIRLSEKLRAEISATYTDYERLNAPDIGGGGNTITKGAIYSYPRSWQPATDFNNYRNSDGSRNGLSGYPYGNIDKFLWWKLYENNKTLQRNQLLTSVELTYEATSWLNIMARAGVDYNTNDLETRNGPTDILGVQNAYYEHGLTKDYVQNFDGIVTAHKDNIFDGFNVSASVGATSWYRNMYGLTGKSPNVFKEPYLYSFNNYDGDFQNGRRPTEQRYEKAINSVFGFVNMEYNNFLFLDITGRNDWSSTLPTVNNSYFYPSVSSSFVFTEVANLPDWLDFGKVRVAFAQAASDAAPYQVNPTYSSGAWGGAATASMKDVLPPIELKPQISNTMDYGLELEFFQQRLNFDFTYYNTKTENQILGSPIPWSSGFSNVTINTGRMQNQGIEISIQGVILESADISWIATFNGARNRNKLLELGEGATQIGIGSIWGDHHGVAMTVEVGEEYGVIKGKNKVYNEDGRPVVSLFYDKSDPTSVVGAGYKSSAQAEIIGNAAPKLTGGLHNNIRFKNFTLGVLIDYKWGGDIWAGDYISSLMGGLSPETLKERDGGGLPYTYPSGETANHGVIIDGVVDVQDYVANPNGDPIWEENTHVVNYLYKYGRNGWSMGLFPQTDGIIENSWIKMREVALTWDLPESIVSKTKVFQGLQVSVIGRDLFYLYSSLPDKINPEGTNGTGNAQGLMFGAMPGTRSVGFSIRAIF